MLRYLSIVMISVLYLVPFYKEYSPHESVPERQKAFEHRAPSSSLDEKPYYLEDFVNKERPDISLHVSSITPVGNNKMFCVWYAGSREGGKDVSIFFAVNNEEKAEWTEPVVLVSREQASEELGRYIKKVGNPLVFNDGRGSLWLFYSTVTVGGWSGTSLNYKVSLDEGQTWTKSRKMLLSPFFNLTNNVKNKGIVLDDGSFILPVYHEFIRKYSQTLRIKPGDNEISYRIEKMTGRAKAVQPSLLYDGGKVLTAFFRNMGPEEDKYILTSYSDDLGDTWSELSDTELPNPNSGFDMIGLDSGAFLGVINNSFQNRDNLAMVISHDNGKTWKTLKLLESLKENEYSYPSISRSEKGLYHITYTYNRRRVKHIAFNEAWIKQMEDSVH